MQQCNLCKSTATELISVLTEKPKLEMQYLGKDMPYYREIRKCQNCGVYFNYHGLQLFDESFYEGTYNEAIDIGTLQARFEKIINLPEEKSDNKHRVKRIVDFTDSYFNNRNINILDVGSGTGVFPYEMSKFFTQVSAVDPDKASVNLMKKMINLKNTWHGSISAITEEEHFDFISFNKVLEHVEDPVQLIKISKDRLLQDGIIYIELPFAEALILQHLQDERAEFFIEHYTTFTFQSINFLIEKSGLISLKTETITEPSGKHTIYAFCKCK